MTKEIIIIFITSIIIRNTVNFNITRNREVLRDHIHTINDIVRRSSNRRSSNNTLDKERDKLVNQKHCYATVFVK